MTHTLFLTALAAGPLASLIYWLGFSWRGPSRAKTAIKALPMGILFLWFWVFQADVTSPAMPLAVLCAWIGDIALSRPGQRAFLLGMGAFAGAHLLLIWVFWDVGVGPIPWSGALLVAGVALGAGLVLWDHTGALRVPVLGYIGVIATMALVGLAVDGDGDATGAIHLGVALFVLSDALLGLETFRAAPRWRVPLSLAIWPTYYGAMVLFAAASVG